METNRSLIKYILLCLITFGIYGLFFWHKYVQDVNTLCSGDGKNTRGILALILLSIITLGIYGFVWTYGMQNRLRDKAGRMGTGPISGGGTILLWQIFGSLLFGLGPLVATYIQIHSINTVAYASQAAQNRQVEQRMNSAAQGF